MTVQEFYATRVRVLPGPDRLRLASLILGDLASESQVPTVDVSDEWTDEDLADLTAVASRGAERDAGWELDDADRG